MNWFKQSAAPPKVYVISYIGTLLSVYIGGKRYEYFAYPDTVKKIESFVGRGWHGKALQVLNKLERAN